MMDSPTRNFGGFHSGERKALRAFARFSEFEPLSKHPRIGLASLRSLCAKGFAEEGPAGIYGPTFRLTAGGLMAVKALEEKPPKRKAGFSIENVELGVRQAGELELVLVTGGTRTAIRLSEEDARRLAEELSHWAEAGKAPRAA